MAEDFEADSNFGYHKSSAKLLVDSGTPQPYLNDRFGLQEWVSDHVRLTERREFTTASKHKLEGVTTEIISCRIIHQTGNR